MDRYRSKISQQKYALAWNHWRFWIGVRVLKTDMRLFQWMKKFCSPIHKSVFCSVIKSVSSCNIYIAKPTRAPALINNTNKTDGIESGDHLKSADHNRYIYFPVAMYTHWWAETKATKGDFITNINYKCETALVLKWCTRTFSLKNPFIILCFAFCILFVLYAPVMLVQHLNGTVSANMNKKRHASSISWLLFVNAFDVILICSIRYLCVCSGNAPQFSRFAHEACCCFGCKIDWSRDHQTARRFIESESSKYYIAIRSYFGSPVFRRHNFLSKIIILLFDLQTATKMLKNTWRLR